MIALNLVKSVFSNVTMSNDTKNSALSCTTSNGHSSSNGVRKNILSGDNKNGNRETDESSQNSVADVDDDMSSSICSEATDDSRTSSLAKRKGRFRRKGKNKKFKSSSSSSSKKQPYIYRNHVKEAHGKPVFGISFNRDLEASGRYVFAACGSNKVSIYECLLDGSIKLHQTFMDPAKDEEYYCCCWTSDTTSYEAVLITAGLRGIIRIINSSLKNPKTSFSYLKGHGLAINDLKIHPQDSNVLMSVSKDHSIRLWNIKTITCIAIFGGVEGHRDEVLYADFHRCGHKIISCGMDHSLKIWSLESEDIQSAIKKSHDFDHVRSEKPFSTARIHFPNFTTRDIHRNYVDCAAWFGDLVISKACENAIVFWKPGKIEKELDDFLTKNSVVSDSTTTFIHQLDLKDSEIWYMRFSFDACQKVLALGNVKGATYVWNIDSDDVDGYTCSILTHEKCTKALRQTCLSQDGTILLVASDDSSVWRWDRVD